jgi:two-component system phosphate regulon sensor histidine kinase PhoR
MTKILKRRFAVVAIAVFIISAYVIAIVLFFANSQYKKLNISNLEETVKAIGIFTPASVFDSYGSAAEWAAGFLNSENKTSYRITLFRRNGEVVYDSSSESSQMEVHLDRPEFQAAITGGIGTASRKSATLGYDQFYAAIGIKDIEGKIGGVIRISETVPGFFLRLLGSSLSFLFIGVCLIFAVCIELYNFSRRLSLSAEAKLDAELQKRTAELKEKTEEAESESRHLEVILNSMFDGVITLDSRLNIILANPRLCSLFGIDKSKNVRGMSLLEFSHSTELTKSAEQVIASGEPHELTLKRYMSGVRQYFQVYAAPLETGRGVVMVLGDISRLVKLEQVRKDFAANVSHELRTPIQVIKGFAENLLDSSPDDIEKIRHFAGIISKNVLTMENISNDLLTLVSLENEDITRPAMEECLLAPLVAEAVDMVELAAKKKGIFIDIICPQDISTKLYESLFVQALVNLLDNGIKYSGGGSSIQVCVSRNENEISVGVKDSGIGIPAEHIDRIFERFYRVDRSRSREAGGTGLGLSIVRHIALLHGGKVVVESHAGEGSIFRISLPAQN